MAYCKNKDRVHYDMKLNVMKSQVVRIGRSHSKAVNDVVIADIIKHKQKIFMLKLQSHSNLVIRRLCSVLLMSTHCTAYIVCHSLFIYVSSVYCYRCFR